MEKRQKVPSVAEARSGAEAHADADKQQLKEKISGRQAAITSAQAKDNKNGRETAEGVAAQKAAENAAAAERVKFEDARKHVAALTAAMTAARREAAELAKRLTNERAAGDRVQASLAAVQTDRDRIGRDKAVAVAALQTAEHTQSALKAKLAASADEQAKASREAARALSSEQAKRNLLQATLASARAQADQTDRDKAAAVAAFRAAESTEADQRVKLADVQKRLVVITADLVVAKREAAGAMKEAKQLASERGDSNALQASLVSAQAKIEQAGPDKEAAAAALYASQRAEADTRAKLAAATNELEEVKRTSAQTTNAAERLAVERSGNGGLQAAVASAQAKADQADHEKTAAIAALHATEAAAAGQRRKLEDTQKEVTTLTAELAGAKRDTEHATRTAQHLTDERVDGSVSRAALISARAEADLAGREKAAAVAALHAAESADAEHGRKLQEAQQQAAALAVQLGSAKREAALSKESAQRLADERVRGGTLQAALASARAEADRAGREKAAAVAALRASESAEAGHQAKLEEARKQMAAVAAELAAAKRVVAQAKQKPDAPVNATREKAPPLSDHVAAVQAKRPSDGIIAHVMLHYSIKSEAARTQAALVKSQLSDLGLDVANSSEPQKHGSGTEITYYYKQDERTAISIANKLKVPDPVRTRISTTQPPRPGTIEVSLGDQTNLRSEASP